MKQRVYEIDVFRAFACFFVILIHTTATPSVSYQVGSLQRILAAILNRSIYFAVPAFIFLSGLTLFLSYKHRDIKVLPFLKKRLLVVLIPYVIWTIIYYFTFIQFSNYQFSIKYFLWALSMGKITYHTYFVVIITQFYMLFFVFDYVYKRYNTHIVTAVCFIINVLFMAFAKVPYKERWLFQYIIFFALGCYFAAHYEQVKSILQKYKYLVLTVYLPVVSYFIYQFYQYSALKKPMKSSYINITWVVFSIVSICLCLLISILVTKYKEKLTNQLRKISKGSYYIYLSHPLVLFFLNYYWKKVGFKSITGKFLINSVLAFMIVIPLSVAYTALKEKLIQGRDNKGAKSLST